MTQVLQRVEQAVAPPVLAPARRTAVAGRLHRAGVFELPVGPCVLDAFAAENALVLACPGRDVLPAFLPAGDGLSVDGCQRILGAD